MQTKKVKGKNWKRALKISEEKYLPVSKAILAVLTDKPMRFGEVAGKVESKLPNFPGSVWWYTVSALRQLEREKKVIRDMGKIVTYRKK